MSHLRAVALLFLFAACDKPAPKAGAAGDEAAAGASGPGTAAAVRAAMAEMFAYSEQIFAIIREHRKDCDAAAARLAERAPAFRELAPRMMAVKQQMDSLPEADREAIKREAEQEAERFRARIPDLEELEQVARQCAKTSPTFDKFAREVMFMKKK